jgi:hypothetical protein
MAMTQASSDQVKVGMLGEKDATDFVYTQIGGVRFYTGTGAPTHASVRGSIHIDVSNGKMHICTVATGTWVVVGVQTT